jgi:hypothetical protein
MWSSVDPLAHKFPGWSTYNYVLNNPIRLTDPDGRAPTDKIIETTKGNFKYVKDQHGTNVITINYLNGDVATTRTGHGTVIVKAGHVEAKRKEYNEAVANRRAMVRKTGDVINKVGDGIAAVGYVAAPFTEGASLGIAAIGEGIALGGKVITNAVNFEESGMTKDNFTNLGVDVALELAPKPLENALKKANLDQIVRNTDPTPITNMVQSSIGKVKLTTDYVVKKQLEENR